MGTWRALDHTADLALEAWGATPEEALEALCAGLLAQITDPHTVEPREPVGIRAEGMDQSEALVGFLGEILYQINVGGWMFRRVEVARAGEHGIRGTAWGEPYDPARHPFDLEVKAATYHELIFRPEGRGWHVRVVFDV